MKPALQLHHAPAPLISPQLRHSLHLLQLPALEFGQTLQAALVANPFLEPSPDEAGDPAVDGDGRDPASDGEAIDAPADAARDDLGLDFGGADAPAAGRGRDDGHEDADPGALAASVSSLREHLHRQIGASRLTPGERLLADLVAEAVDDDGYLRLSDEDLERLAAGLPAHAADGTTLAMALRFVQSLDPAGVAARSPGECLALQLQAMPPSRPGRELALKLVRDHLPLLAAHDASRLCHAAGCSAEALHEAHALILRLDPHPGRRFGPDATRYVVADVVVRQAGERWVARINPQVLPRLRINQRYVQALRAEPGRPARALADQLQEARWLLRSVRQRFETIQRVAQAVVDRQHRFFQHGEIGLRPLLQRDVAQALGLHPSTVSRVVQGKTVATPRGLVPFSRFFDGGLDGGDGPRCAAEAVRALIRELIAAEPAGQPLSDLKLTRQLAERGVRVARRTVTKYRDAMGIPPWEARRLAAPVSPPARSRS